jgi:hypothetical protein
MISKTNRRRTTSETAPKRGPLHPTTTLRANWLSERFETNRKIGIPNSCCLHPTSRVKRLSETAHFDFRWMSWEPRAPGRNWTGSMIPSWV